MKLPRVAPSRCSQSARQALSITALAVTLVCGATLAHAGVPYPTKRTPAAQDIGAFAASAATAQITVTVALKLRNAAELDRLISSLYTPGSSNFHQFLTSAQFHERFAPSAQTIADASAYFTHAGLAVRVDAGRLLQVTGNPAAIEAAFSVKLRQYEVASRLTAPAYRFRAPDAAPRIAAEAVAANVDGIAGLDNRPRFAPRSTQANRAAPTLQRAANAAPKAGSNALNEPGQWTVSDLASYYNVKPLYDRGLHGEGRTVGIVTLASFTPSDAFAYWSSVGLPVDPNRLTVINVDGGPGAPSDDSGSSETTLDVEQSGGLAPAAKLIVYQSPNTDQGFIDNFAKAIDDNIAETLSVSWGLWEWFDTQSNVTTARGRSLEALKVYNSLFIQAAAQGQSMFAAAGDAGAYDVNRGNPVPDYTATLSVDAPSSSPWITAAGGTTLPGTQVFKGPDGQPFPVTLATEQAWSWSYLTGLCAALGFDPVACGTFPVGGGGGVSAYNRIPLYQQGVPGIRRTEAGQSLIDFTTTPPTDVVDLPAHYAGRNVPDVSLNADPETGYALTYTSDQTGFGVINYYGGTSFVAPQLNGITALLGQAIGGRVGLLNYPLYALARLPVSYTGAHAPFHDIATGDNWFYRGEPGYDQATGVGTLDVANFSRALGLVAH